MKKDRYTIGRGPDIPAHYLSNRPKYPKGGMCATCTKSADDCSVLHFDSMRAATKNSDAVICTEYKRNAKK